MAKVTKSSGGAWLDKKILRSGDVIKFVTEPVEEESQNGVQLVGKVKLKGGDPEPRKLAINTPSKNALIDAFGDDTVDWMDKLLTLHIEKTRIGGKAGVAAYLVPEGYEVGDDAAGYLVIGKAGTVSRQPIARTPDDGSDINPDDVPF